MNMNYVKQDNIKRITDQCFDRDSEKAAGIIKGILDARSPRISDVSHAMEGASSDSNYRSIHRFLHRNDPKEALHRLHDDESSYVIGDPTEIERPQAKNTEYVGKLPGDVRGYWILLLATPYKGRAIPFSFVTYSSSTINSECSSRNMKHTSSISEVKELIGDKILILDKEFSYEWFLSELVESGISFVICLNKENGVRITDEEGNQLSLLVGLGEEAYQRGVYYKGKIEVNIAGKWDKGFSDPLWVISNLAPEEALSIYSLRMKVEESFRDLKSLLNMDKQMNRKQEHMEKMLAMVLLAYCIGFLLGEEMRDQAYREGRKWERFSGLFVLLKQNVAFSKRKLAEIIDNVFIIFRRIIFGCVRSHV